MKQLFTIGIMASAAVVVQAQDVKFGKFSSEEITKSESKINKEAAAEVLYSKVDYKIDWNRNTGNLEKTTVVHTRVKVFDKDKAPNSVLAVEIPLQKREGSADLEKLFSFKASTFNPEGNSTKEIKVNKSDLFKKNIHRNLDVQTFTFPNVQNGSIIEYTYEINSPFINNAGTWYFQDNIPVVKSQLFFTANEVLNYQDDIRGQYNLNQKSTTKNEIVGTGSYILNQKQFTAENLPGYEREAYVLNPRNLLASARFELASYHPKNGLPEQFATTWERIGADLIDDENFGRQLNGNGFLDDKVKELTANLTSSEDKMQAIFNFIKTNYTWNDYNGIYTDKGIRKTFNEKTGNVADINLMLVSMLQKAGFDANPVVLSTVQNGLLNYVFPSRAKLNYVIASVKLNGNQYLMDGTELNSRINILPIRALNQRGFVINKKGIEEVELINSIMSTSKTQVNAILTADGKISGTYNNYYDNYFYMNAKDEFTTDPKAYEKEFIENYTFEIDGFRVLDNNEGIIRNSFKFNNIQTDVIGNKIILNPLLFIATTSHDLNYDKRNYNLEFGTPMTISKQVKIKIPDGYKVESLPKEYQEKIVNDAAGFGYKYEEKDGFIIINTARVLPYSILPFDYYPHFKKFMTSVVEAETQQIVLVKI